MKQSTRAERLGARVLYVWGLMNIAEIARDTGRAQKTIHTWKKSEGWLHPDDQPEFGQWPDTLDVAEAGPPEHQMDRPQDPPVVRSDVRGTIEEAHQTADPELLAERKAAQAKLERLQAELERLQAEHGELPTDVEAASPGSAPTAWVSATPASALPTRWPS